ncbi:MAG: hypothetical protein R2771_10200 [Saprospiraceae bacterium]
MEIPQNPLARGSDNFDIFLIGKNAMNTMSNSWKTVVTSSKLIKEGFPPVGF